MVLDSVHLPKDINKAIIIINLVIFVTVVSYNAVSGSESIIPHPLVFLFSSFVSIFICLCIWGYKEAVYNDFERNHGNLAMQHFSFYHGYAGKLNMANAVSVVGFFFFHLIAFYIQFR